jgi:hypothetical protein
MANCNKCAYSHIYWKVETDTWLTRCVAPIDFSMETKEGEHDCQAFKVNDFDEKRIDIVGTNGNIALHYKDDEK